MNDKPDKPKRDYSHLKKYHFKKGQVVPGRGRKKGISKEKKKEIGLEIFQEALQTCPNTGKRLTHNQIVQRLSKMAEKSPRVLLETFNRIFGPVQLPEQQARVIFQFPDMQTSKQEVSDLDDKDTIEGQIIQYELDDK